MEDKKSGLLREFGNIQKERRIAIPKIIMEHLGWEVGDHVVIEVYRGRVFIENLSASLRPLPERLK